MFPGTNCEYDSARAFERAGAAAEIFVVRNLSAADIEETTAQLARRLHESQILMIPGGFSGGDEPDGSGKFIAALLREARVADAVSGLMKRDGLILGICNGFQALIKLGLVPYGEIRDMRQGSPTLTFNAIGRHVSVLVRTRVCANASPWLMSVKPGDIFYRSGVARRRAVSPRRTRRQMRSLWRGRWPRSTWTRRANPRWGRATPTVPCSPWRG